MKEQSAKIVRKHLDEIDSTNRYARGNAKQLWQEGCKALIVTAGKQTAGRGQRGNTWQSQEGKNILATIVLHRPKFAVKEQFRLSQTIASAASNALRSIGIDACIKWPNDIYVGVCKIAGILIEVDLSGEEIEWAYIGIGVNINQEEFDAMDRLPTSVKLLTGKTYDTEEFLDMLISNFIEKYSLPGAALHKEYIASLMGREAPLCYRDISGETFEAVIEDVDNDGRITLRHSDSTATHHYFKEVELLLPNREKL